MGLAADEPSAVDVADGLASLETSVRSVMVVREETLQLAVVALLSRGHRFRRGRDRQS